MAAICGTSKVLPAQIQIFKDIMKKEKLVSRHKKGSISLENAVIESKKIGAVTSFKKSPTHDSSVNLPNAVTNMSTVNQIYNSTSQADPTFTADSTSQADPTLKAESFIFTLTTARGELHEFCTDTEKERIRWMEVLQLLIQYPYSWIPEEPDFDHIKDVVRKSLDPVLYHAGELVSLSLISLPF